MQEQLGKTELMHQVGKRTSLTGYSNKADRANDLHMSKLVLLRPQEGNSWEAKPGWASEARRRNKPLFKDVVTRKDPAVHVCWRFEPATCTYW